MKTKTAQTTSAIISKLIVFIVMIYWIVEVIMIRRGFYGMSMFWFVVITPMTWVVRSHVINAYNQMMGR